MELREKEVILESTSYFGLRSEQQLKATLGTTVQKQHAPQNKTELRCIVGNLGMYMQNKNRSKQHCMKANMKTALSYNVLLL